jgi:uncharacterized protein YdhG (YjbR/CyaY superfamily)
MKSYKTVSEYMKSVPKEHAAKLKEMRTLVTGVLKQGEETIRYGMPTIQINGKNVVHFAYMKGHLGFYPAPSGVHAFEAELTKRGISFSKGCIRFPYDKPLPIALIKKILSFRLKEERS